MPAESLSGLRAVGLGAAALCVLDQPLGRRLLDASLWAPALLLAQLTTTKPRYPTVLEALAAAVRDLRWCPELLGNVAGLLLLREALNLALRLKRALCVAGGELLLTPTSSPNALTASWAKMSKAILKLLTTAAMGVGAKVPVVAGVLKEEVAKEVRKMEADFLKTLRPDDRDALHAMPTDGLPAADIAAMMRSLAQEEDKKWADGYVSGAVYHGEAAHLQLLNEAYSSFSVSNPLHPDIWPSGMKFEAEVIGWVADLMRGGDDGVVGSLTSGGTESIVLAAKAHRDRARALHGIGVEGSLITTSSAARQPEIIACVSAHAAIDKACDLMGIKLVKVPMTDDYAIDVSAVCRAISADTIMVYSSAPSFPQVGGWVGWWVGGVGWLGTGSREEIGKEELGCSFALFSYSFSFTHTIMTTTTTQTTNRA